jgi:hypothetical protein
MACVNELWQEMILYITYHRNKNHYKYWTIKHDIVILKVASGEIAIWTHEIPRLSPLARLSFKNSGRCEPVARRSRNSRAPAFHASVGLFLLK